MFYHLLKAVLIDFLELCFQFALKSTVIELEICSLHQNEIEFHQKTNGVCFRMEMTAKEAICRQFLFTYAFLLVRTHAGPLCTVQSQKSQDVFTRICILSRKPISPWKGSQCLMASSTSCSMKIGDLVIGSLKFLMYINIGQIGWLVH